MAGLVTLALIAAATQRLAPRSTGAAAALIFGTMLTALLLAHLALRASPTTVHAGPLLVLAAVVAWGLPVRVAACAGLGTPLCRACILAGLAAAVVALAGRRITSAVDRAQAALATVGISIAPRTRLPVRI